MSSFYRGRRIRNESEMSRIQDIQFRQKVLDYNIKSVEVAELVDAHDSGSCG